MLTQDNRIAIAEIADACGIDLVRGANGRYCFQVRPHLAYQARKQIEACRAKCAELALDTSEILD